MPDSDKFVPRGEKLSMDDLLAIASISDEDIDDAIATAHPSIRPYLIAKLRWRAGLQVTRTQP